MKHFQESPSWYILYAHYFSRWNPFSYGLRQSALTKHKTWKINIVIFGCMESIDSIICVSLEWFFPNRSCSVYIGVFVMWLGKVLYICSFSCGFNFRWVRDLPETTKNRFILYIFIESPWNSENRTHWKFNTPSKRHFRQNFPEQNIPDIR